MLTGEVVVEISQGNIPIDTRPRMHLGANRIINETCRLSAQWGAFQILQSNSGSAFGLASAPFIQLRDRRTLPVTTGGYGPSNRVPDFRGTTYIPFPGTGFESHGPRVPGLLLYMR